MRMQFDLIPASDEEGPVPARARWWLFKTGWSYGILLFDGSGAFHVQSYGLDVPRR